MSFAPTIFTTPNGTIRVHSNDFESDMTCKWIISVAIEKVILNAKKNDDIFQRFLKMRC